MSTATGLSVQRSLLKYDGKIFKLIAIRSLALRLGSHKCHPFGINFPSAECMGDNSSLNNSLFRSSSHALCHSQHPSDCSFVFSIFLLLIFVFFLFFFSCFMICRRTIPIGRPARPRRLPVRSYSQCIALLAICAMESNWCYRMPGTWHANAQLRHVAAMRHFPVLGRWICLLPETFQG